MLSTENTYYYYYFYFKRPITGLFLIYFRYGQTSTNLSAIRIGPNMNLFISIKRTMKNALELAVGPTCSTPLDYTTLPHVFKSIKRNFGQHSVRSKSGRLTLTMTQLISPVIAETSNSVN